MTGQRMISAKEKNKAKMKEQEIQKVTGWALQFYEVV